MDIAAFEHDLLEHALDVLAEGVFVVDDSGIIQRVNAAFEKILGYRAQEIKGKFFYDIQHTFDGADDATRRNVTMFNLYFFNRCEQEPMHMTLIDSRRRQVPVRMRTVLKHSPDGTVVCGAGIFSEVTGNAAAAGQGAAGGSNTLWEIEQTFQSVLDNSGDAILITDFNGKIVTVNRGLLELLQQDSAEAFMERFIIELGPFEGAFQCTTGETVAIDSAFQEQQIESINRLLEDGTARCELYLFRRDGLVVPVEATLSLLKNHAGERRGTLCICRDMTERLRTQRELTRARDFLDHIINTTADGIYVTDAAGCLIIVNQALCGMTGYAQSDMIGKYGPDLLPDYPAEADDSDMIARTFEDSYFDDYFETYWQRIDGTVFPVETKLTPLINQAGEMLGMVGSTRDITERKRVEEELRRARDELEEKVRERTANLKEANTALSVLLQNRDEDQTALRDTVLTNVRELLVPYLERLKQSGLSADQRTYVDIIDANLQEVVSPFVRALSLKHFKLTAMETRVANMVKQGRATRKIAEILQVSTKTVDFHRDNIRKKLGLKNKKVNLRTYLLSLQ